MSAAQHPSKSRPIDRSQRPDIPAVIEDLWHGWGYNGLPPYHSEAEADMVTALKGVTSIVNALAQDDKPYSVTLDAKTQTAQSDLGSRQVKITTAALADERLQPDERLAVTTAMAIHEAGHARLTRPMSVALEKAYRGEPHARQAIAGMVGNVLEDVRLESRTADQWPVFADLFVFGAWWVANRYKPGGVTRMPADQREAFNLAVSAIRYDPFVEWSTDPAVLAERRWWRRWAERSAASDSPTDYVAAVREAVQRIERYPAAKAEQGQGGGKGEPQKGKPEQSDGPSFPTEGQPEPQPSEGSGEGKPQKGIAAGKPDAEPEDGDGEADGDGDLADADGDEAETTYRHSDAPASGQSEAPDAEHERKGGQIVYGNSGVTEIDDPAMTVMAGKTPERDALSEPLPLHPAEAATNDDRNRDITVNAELRADAQRGTDNTVTVIHKGNHHVKVQISHNKAHRPPYDVPLDTDSQGALRAAFAARKTSRDNRMVARSGRLSASRAYRVRAGFDNVFTRRDSLSPDRIDLHLLVDASGSMERPAEAKTGSFTEMESARKARSRIVDRAVRLAANMVSALDRVPTIRVKVWSHNTTGGTHVWDILDTRRGDSINRTATIAPGGSNNDASAIRAVGETIIRERSQREQSILMVLSDGAPCEPEDWVRGAVETLRDKGVGVVSVAMDGGLTETQEQCYGREYVVRFSGDWQALGRDMAEKIGRLA